MCGVCDHCAPVSEHGQQGCGKVFYVGGAVGEMGIGYNEFITMFYIQAKFKLKNP